MALENYVGRSLDNLSYRERLELAGRWVAVEIYSPETLPLRLFQAVGESASECRKLLKQRGLDIMKFEFVPVPPPF